MMMYLFIVGFLLFVTGMVVAAIAEGDGLLTILGVIISCCGGYMVGTGLVQAFAQ